MKKLTLTSLLAVFAVSGAYAANTIDNNPLYRPDEGRFYSVTSLGSNSEATENWALAQEFGYGITKDLAVVVGTAFVELDSFDANAWGPLSIGLNYRVLNDANWKLDAFGSYNVAPVWGDHAPFLDEANTEYTWTLGVRGGYVANDFTIAGHVAYDYTNFESFNWGDDGLHQIRVGLDGQYLINNDWNLVAGVEYTGITDDGFEDAGTADGYLGVNYNFDSTKYLGAFLTKEMANGADGWEFVDGFGFGVKFGVDF